MLPPPRAIALGLLATATSVVALPSEAGASRRLFRMFTGEDGLSQLSVSAVVQDPDGFLWVGTQSGLNRFDGQRFVVFTEQQGLSHSRVQALALAPDGALWIGTERGLDRMRDGRVEAIVGGASEAVSVESLAVAVDGTLWIGTDRGLARMVDGRLRFEATLGRVPILGLARGLDADDIWVTTELRGLWRGGRRGFSPRGGEHGVERTTVAWVHRDGRVFVGTSDGRVHIFEGDAWRSSFVVDEATRAAVLSLFVDRRGALWIGDSLGLVRRDADALHRFGRQERLRISNVTSLLEDDGGALWVGGFGGLARFVGRAFEIFDEADGLPSANTRPIVRARDGALWVGTVAGIARSDGDGRFTALGSDAGLAGVYALALLEDRDGRIWAGTHRGLSVFEAGRWRRVTIGGAERVEVTALAEDRAGRVWVTAAGAGVYRGGTGGLEPVRTSTVGFTDPRMVIDRRDRVWVSFDEGLLRFDGETVEEFASDAYDFAAQRPYFLAEGPEGGIWFGYHASVGFSRFDGRRIRTWTHHDGLSDDSVYSLGFDASGALWIGTARGVDRFLDGRFVNYGPTEGYPSTESNSGGFLLEPDGRMWFGTAEGLGRYDPRLDERAKSPVHLRLGAVTVGGRAVAVDGVEVPPADADLDVSVELVSFEHPRHLELRGRLLGLSDRWTALAAPRWSVPALAPGTYRLQVEARRRGGAWTRAPGRRFEVRAPWWRTGWAFVLGVLTLAGLGYGAARYNALSLARQNERLSEMVAERTEGLEAKTAELERTQAFLQKTNRELVAASRAKSQFVTNVSHEIRTPMNGIMGMTELALGEPVSPRVREYLETVRASAMALLGLINDILDLSRVESGRLSLDPEPMSLRELLEGIRRAHDVVAVERGLTLSVDVQSSLPDRWVADAGRLRQVLVNLVGNALKFTPEGFVRVEVRAEEPDAGAGARRLRFLVHDSGIGIPKAQSEAVFEMFTQVDGSSTRAYGGTGLGLTICREIVSLMGGQIRLESQEGVGSTFWFTARLTPAPEAQPSPSAPETPSPGPPRVDRPLDVLVAEDNAVNRLVVRRMLERLGHDVKLVEDGEQAVHAVREGTFDVVIMDVQMPNVDGLEAVRRIRAREGAAEDVERLPIVALTAHAMQGDRERTLAVGMDAYLTKPVSPEALRRTLERLCRPGGRLSSGAGEHLEDMS